MSEERRDELAEGLVNLLRERGLTLATAESCTGGNIAHQITLVPGASEVFLGGVVSYSNAAKMRLLDVGQSAIESFGAVSRAVVMEMALGATRVFETDCAVATSGIAGPGGGTPDKPVGTVWIATLTPYGGLRAYCPHFSGSRAEIIAQATGAALEGLRQRIENRE